MHIIHPSMRCISLTEACHSTLELEIKSCDFLGKLVKAGYNWLKIGELSLNFGEFSLKIG